MPKFLNEISDTLRQKYMDFAHNNQLDPLDELLFITCSLMTTEKGYSRVYKALRELYPSAERVRDASPTELEQALAPGGLAVQKSRRIKKTLRLIEHEFGTLSLESLKQMSDEDAEKFLTKLPGVGLKTARCVMLYSLGRKVFPVDTHCWRISRRIGWVRPTRAGVSPSNKDANRLQTHIPADLRFSLHVNFISLGREFCQSRFPKCGTCPIQQYCSKVGVPKPNK